MKRHLARLPGILAITAFFPVAALIVVAFWPFPIPPLPAFSGASLDKSSADLFGAAIFPGLNPICRPTVLSHGRKTPVSYLLMHGLSNCPAQFANLGRLLHEKGSNVLIPLLPDHGQTNRLTPDYGNMTLEDLARWASEAVEAASQMGDTVVVVGLSVSGTTALWLAMQDTRVDRAVILAPFLGPTGLPIWLNAPAGRLLARLPNMFVWWDSTLREANPGPPQAYPGFPTRLVGRIMVLGSALLDEAAREVPACRDITFITSEADTAVDIPMVREAAARLSAHPGVAVREIWFPAAEGVLHDFIDPRQPREQTARLEPLLVQWLTGGASSSDASGL
ncbi:MAG: hypothetical protein Fur0032_22940 [Terrimicrobiaceae bacterium]